MLFFFSSTSIDCIYDVYVHWLENDKNIEHTTAKDKRKKAKQRRLPASFSDLHFTHCSLTTKKRKEGQKRRKSKKGPERKVGGLHNPGIGFKRFPHKARK